jgi:hypothetical protein
MKTAIIAALCTAALLGAGLVMYASFVDEDLEIEIGDRHFEIPKLVDRAPRTMRTIYLHRGGVTLTAGVDASHENRSSVVKGAGLEKVKIPAFAGSDKRWRDVVTCVKKQYERFDVDIVEERPSEPGYVMAVFGGQPALLKAGKRVGGLAPFNSEAIEDPVVFIFSRALGEQTRAVCETAAMEIAHTYGLDHEHTCKDPMGYLGGCGARWFQDAEFVCGEHEKRACADGKPTQNSVARLMAVLGPRKRAAR